MKKDLLDFKIFSDWEASITQTGRLENIIIERITYIIHTLFEKFDMKLDTWYFDDAGESQVGNLADHYGKYEIDSIAIELNKNFKYKDISIIDRFGEEWSWGNSIPIRWLFEDFEKEIIDGKVKYIEKEAARKSRQKELSANKKKKDQLLIEQAKKKLSTEELAAIKRSL